MVIFAILILFTLFAATGNTHEGKATATSLVLGNTMMAEAVFLPLPTSAAAAVKMSTTTPPAPATIATACKPVVSLDLDRAAFSNFSGTLASMNVSMEEVMAHDNGTFHHTRRMVDGIARYKAVMPYYRQALASETEPSLELTEFDIAALGRFWDMTKDQGAVFLLEFIMFTVGAHDRDSTSVSFTDINSLPPTSTLTIHISAI